MYYVFCTTSDDNEKGETTYSDHVYAVIVDKESAVFGLTVINENSVAEITEPSSYYDTIIELKKQNGWK